MIPKIRLYGFSISDEAKSLLEEQLATITKRIGSYDQGVVSLSIVIKKHDKHSFYSGQLLLSLPKKNLVITYGSTSEYGWLHGAFEKMRKEFEKYKGKHFTSGSTYPDRRSIRKDVLL